MGLIAGGILLGQINPQATDFFQAFVGPWFTAFSVLMGIFVCCLFSYFAAIYLVGETGEKDLKPIFILRAKLASVAVLVTGAAVFLEGLFAEAPLFLKFVSDPVSLFCGFAAAALTLPLWKNLSKWPPWSSRIVVGVQFLLAGAGWCKIQYPFILPPSPAYGFEGLGFHNAAAPESTLKYLLIALGVGSGLIFPALIYLIKSLKLR